MNTEQLEKDRVKLSNILKTLTRGEILAFDYFVDYMGYRKTRPNIIIYLAVPKQIKEDNFDKNKFLEKHMNSIQRVLEAGGYGDIFTNNFFLHFHIV